MSAVHRYLPIPGLPGVLLTLVLLTCLAPSVAALLEALLVMEQGSSLGFLLEERHRELFARSVLVAGTATALALLWGTATAVVVATSRGALGRLVEWLSWLPLLLPPMVVVLGWMYFLGQAGFAMRLLQDLLALEKPPGILYTPIGAGFVLSLCYYPFVSILAAQGIRSLPEAQVHAARLVAGPARRLWGLWRPALAPCLATGSLLVFLVSFADFSVPSALRLQVYPIEIHARLGSDLLTGQKGAALLALPPLIFALVLCLLRHVFVRSAPLPTLGIEAPTRAGSTMVSRPSRVAGAICTLALALAVGVPMLFLLLTAGPPASYARAARVAGAQLLTSLEVALWATGLLLLLGGVFAFAYRQSPRRRRIRAEALVLLLLVIPGSAVGLGILTLESRGIPPWSWVYPHPAIVAYAAACRFLPLAALVLAGAFVSVRRRVLEAGAASGAGPLRILTVLVAPLVLPALIAAAVLSYVLSLGELSAAVLVTPPGVMTLPVRLASLLHFGEEPVVAALCVMLSGCILGLLGLTQSVLGRPWRVELSLEEPMVPGVDSP
jgi:iron(III) transport system permease protein